MYPSAPLNVFPEKLVPSASFKTQVAKVITTIFLFLIVYLILIITATALAAACIYAGIAIIIAMPKFLTAMVGLGLIAFAGSVLFFLVKFIFAVTKNNNDGRIEITEDEQPALFAFIRQLTIDTNTQFPKKIFLSPDVNACVFYHSSFWSMFLPVRKNLEIGVGLINSINLSEFKAVMAHEFGHFSQRSMKLASFTYNTNRIIYNMLYDNTSYTSFLQSWGNIHGILGLFAILTSKIAVGIQLILKGMYKLINKSYLALSREMEFHADTIAASVAGGNNLVSALSRIEVAGSCYSSALETANIFLKDKKVAKNIYLHQLTVFRHMAKTHELPLKQGLPEISFQFISSFSKSRINYKDQWASHPTLEERKQHMESVAMNAASDESSPWQLFSNAATLQETITGTLYAHLPHDPDNKTYDENDFEIWHTAQLFDYELPAAYKGFYDSRYVDLDGWNFISMSESPVTFTFDQLFNDENGQLQSSIRTNERDIETLKAIKEKRIDTSSFDFDGVKYTISDCDEIIQQLEKENTEANEKQASLDKQAFAFFCQYNKEMIIDAYQLYSARRKKNQHFTDLVIRAFEQMTVFYDTPTLEQVQDAIRSIKLDELELKNQLRMMMAEGLIKTAGLPERLKTYIDSQYVYFEDGDFKNDELNSFRNILHEVVKELDKVLFGIYKKMLEKQLEAAR